MKWTGKTENFPVASRVVVGFNVLVHVQCTKCKYLIMLLYRCMRRAYSIEYSMII